MISDACGIVIVYCILSLFVRCVLVLAVRCVRIHNSLFKALPYGVSWQDSGSELRIARHYMQHYRYHRDNSVRCCTAMIHTLAILE
jgi:hypothetical protein